MIGFFYLVFGISLLYFSGDWLVDGSTSLARHMKVKPFVIALTLVAFGTSAPELAISVHSALKGYEGITLGNIVGSNIANVLFALPLAFLIKIPKKCDLKSIDHFIIGLTVVALGTSIPEVVTSMVAAYRGQIGFVLGAILGSNLFNLLAITGIASIITGINTSNVLDKIDIYYLIFSTIIFILISLLLKHLNKKLIFVVLISYFIYVVFIYLRMV